MGDLASYTNDELRDALSKVEAHRYPAEAAALMAERTARVASGRWERLLYRGRCAARVGWWYTGYPLAGIQVYAQHLSVTAWDKTFSVAIGEIRSLSFQREFLARYLVIEHTNAATPELAIWMPRTRQLVSVLEKARAGQTTP